MSENGFGEGGEIASMPVRRGVAGIPELAGDEELGPRAPVLIRPALGELLVAEEAHRVRVFLGITQVVALQIGVGPRDGPAVWSALEPRLFTVPGEVEGEGLAGVTEGTR